MMIIMVVVGFCDGDDDGDDGSANGGGDVDY